MKKLKNKKFFFSKILGFILLTFFFTGIVHGIDVIGDYIKKQDATGKGSNNNQITFSKDKITYYIDEGNDGKLEFNKFLGYYYDNIYGFFRLDWSENKIQNVHISTEKVFNTVEGCSEGLKLKGKAFSENVGFIDFNYDLLHFVYYCKDDNTIYGKGYSKILGTQVFNGIKIKKLTSKTIEIITDKKGITNDTNEITNDDGIGGGDKNTIEDNSTEENITDSESMFWIIK